jgi:cell division protein FtsW
MGSSNAQRWIEIFGFKFQPLELAKMAVLLYTASVASEINKEDENSQKLGFWKILACMGGFCVLIVGENLSTAALLCVTVILMMLICGVSPKRTWKLIGAGAAFVAVVLAFFLLVPATKMNTLAEQNLIPGRATTWQARVLDFFDEKQTAKEYALTTAKDKPQETHAKIAIATSGLVWGKGIGNSEERDFIQEATCDFIYAIIIEECGMLISIAVLGLYIWMMYICGTIISKPITPFTSYLVVGIAILLGLQAMINMMVAVGAMPVTGQPLPLISKGGTSMLFSSIYFGFLIGISRGKEQDEKEEMTSNVKATE